MNLHKIQRKICAAGSPHAAPSIDPSIAIMHTGSNLSQIPLIPVTSNLGDGKMGRRKHFK